MSVQHVKYLLVGGRAASSAAAAIRDVDPAGSIVLVSQEIVRPYFRTPLSREYLRRQMPRDDLFIHGKDWFEANRIELRTGRRAAHLDVSRSTVALENGETIGYEKLLLAAGMTPRQLEVPGAQLPNLFYFRTLEDVHQLQTAVDKARLEGQPHTLVLRGGPRGTAVVIGAGLLGVELAASLSQLGISIDLLCGGDHPWNRFAGEIAGKVVATFLEKRGIRVHANARPLRLEGDGRVQRVVLNEGKAIDCDFAIAAVGAVVNRELLRGTSIEAEKAILTDAHCRTNVPNIYAAGDGAAIFDPLFGKHRILDHRGNAPITGTLAGRNMAGRDESYAAVNTFHSNCFDLTVRGWGEGKLVDRRLVRNVRSPNGAPPDLIEIGVAADGRVAQVLSIGHAGDEDLLRGLVARRARIEGMEEKLKDPAVPLAEAIG